MALATAIGAYQHIHRAKMETSDLLERLEALETQCLDHFLYSLRKPWPAVLSWIGQEIPRRSFPVRVAPALRSPLAAYVLTVPVCPGATPPPHAIRGTPGGRAVAAWIRASTAVPEPSDALGPPPPGRAPLVHMSAVHERRLRLGGGAAASPAPRPGNRPPIPGWR